MPNTKEEKKQTYDERKRAKLCTQCGKRPAINSSTVCEEHAKIRREKINKRREKITKHKHCIDCKGLLGDNRVTRCSSCLLVNLMSSIKYREKQSEEIKERHRIRRERIKDETFKAYGGWKCTCCGNDRKECLSLDHVEGGGGRHRRSIGNGHTFYQWLRKNGYPKGYRILCMSCNFAKRYKKECPHEREQRFVITTSGVVGDKIGQLNVLKAAPALGRICRFAGNCNQFWSVLQHSLVVNDLAHDSIKLLALVHDISETVISDIPSPFKIPEMQEIELRIQTRLYSSLGLNPSEEDFRKLKEADHRAFIGEIGTVATEDLRKIYPGRDLEAEEAVRKYLNYPIEDSCKKEGKLVGEFVRRFNKLHTFQIN